VRADNFMYVEVPSLECNLKLVKLTVGAFAVQLPFTIDELDDIKLAVSEAVTNCIVHAYPDEAGLIKVRCESIGGVFQVTVEDQGVGIADIGWAREAANTTSVERMGIGLSVIEQTMSSMTIESAVGRGTGIVMAKVPERSRGEQG